MAVMDTPRESMKKVMEVKDECGACQHNCTKGWLLKQMYIANCFYLQHVGPSLELRIQMGFRHLIFWEGQAGGSGHRYWMWWRKCGQMVGA